MAGEKILVVDDAKNVRDIFTYAFDEYDILTAKSAEEARAVLSRPNDIDLIVLDVMMPGMNGLELLGEVKRKNEYCKVVIMTGYSSKDIAIEALRLNADEYIEKPFDIEKTKEIFERLLSEARSMHGEPGERVEKKVRFAQRLAKRNYNRPCSLRDVSREVSASYKYLSRVFKEKTGEGFNDYRVGLKIAAAKRLLRERRFTVAQIAYKVGYRNSDSFMKMFKKKTGLTPSEYRRDGKEKKAQAAI